MFFFQKLGVCFDLFEQGTANESYTNHEDIDHRCIGEEKRFVEMFLPERVNDIELYDGNEPIFDAYGIEMCIRDRR